MLTVLKTQSAVIINLIHCIEGNQKLLRWGNNYPMIVYKKADEWYIEWQRVTTNDNEWQCVYNKWQRMTTSENEWWNEWQLITASDNEWYNKWQRMTASDNEWQRVTTSGTTSDNEWKWVTKSDNE